MKILHVPVEIYKTAVSFIVKRAGKFVVKIQFTVLVGAVKERPPDAAVANDFELGVSVCKEKKPFEGPVIDTEFARMGLLDQVMRSEKLLLGFWDPVIPREEAGQGCDDDVGSWSVAEGFAGTPTLGAKLVIVIRWKWSAHGGSSPLSEVDDTAEDKRKREDERKSE